MGGMDHGSMAGMDHGAMSGMDHGAMAAGASAAAADHGSSHSMGGMNMRDKSKVPDSVKVGVGVDAIAMSPVDRTGDPGVGLEDVGHKVLTYRDLMSLTPNTDTRPPHRTLEVHLPGHMSRFTWSFDGDNLRYGYKPTPLQPN